MLANIREVDAIAHVVRCYADADVTHVGGRIDPVADIETIETELMLADLESLEKRVDGLDKKAKGSDEDADEAKATLDLIERALTLLREGKPARFVERKPEEEKALSHARAAHLAAGALRLQRRRGVGRDRQRVVPQGRAAREGGGRRLRGDLGQDRGRDRRRCRRRSARTISPTSASRSPASTG